MKIKVSIGQHEGLSSLSDERHRSGYVFTYDRDCRDYDWFVAYEDVFEGCGKDKGRLCETLACPREQTIFCTWEPVSIKSYSKHFTRQFGHLLTNRPPEAEHHPHYHLGRGYFRWFNGHSYNDLTTLELPPKTKTISAVCSNKQMRHTRHQERFLLMQTLAAEIDGFDWFGRGVRPFGKKYEVMDAYKYHVAVENHIAPHHWTEKLADSILSECLTFYAGDPAIGEVLPEECLVPIPIDNPQEAVKIIHRAIADGLYEKRRDAILEAKRRLLEKFNFWDQIIAVIEASADQKTTPLDPENPPHLYSRHCLRRQSLGAAVEDFLLHAKRGFR